MSAALLKHVHTNPFQTCESKEVMQKIKRSFSKTFHCKSSHFQMNKLVGNLFKMKGNIFLQIVSFLERILAI